MKKLSVLFFAIGCISIWGCNNEGGMSAKAKKNIEVNEAISKAFESGDFSKMADYIAADAVDHGGQYGDVKGVDSIVAEMKRYRTMMPDMKSSNQVSVANDDYVFTRATVTGTMNGRPTTMTSVDVARFVDGKAVEHWIYMNPADLLPMMQAPPHMPETTTPADTSSSKPDSSKK